MEMEITPEECSNFAKLIHNNSPESFLFLSNAKNLINKKLLVGPEKRLIPFQSTKPEEVINGNRTTATSRTMQQKIETVDKLFSELGKFEALETKHPTNKISRRTNKSDSRQLSTANTTIAGRRNCSMIPPGMRKSYDDISMVSNMWVPPSSSTPFIAHKPVQKSKSRDTTDMSMIFATTGTDLSLSNIPSLALTDFQQQSLSDEVLANVDQMANRSFRNIDDITDADAQIFKHLQANLNKLREFLANIEKCVPLQSDSSGGTIDASADVIDSSFCRQLRIVKEVI